MGEVDLSEEEWRWVDSSDSLKTHALLFATLAIGSLPFVYGLQFGQFPYFLSLASLSVYIGAHRSLDADQIEQVTLRQSLLVPVFASCFLFGFYLITKYFPGFTLQRLVDLQFGIVGTFAIGRLLSPFLANVSALSSIHVKLPDTIVEETDGKAVILSGSDIAGAIVGCLCVLIDISLGHHMHTLNNFIACSLAIELLQVRSSVLPDISTKRSAAKGIGIKSTKAGAALLLGLLVYDVFWVFFSPDVVGENVMLKVATSNVIEGPLKLILPNGKASGTYPFSILGLGDIAVPGIFAALMLRFDFFKKDSVKTESETEEPPTPFNETGLCYSMQSTALCQLEDTELDEVPDENRSCAGGVSEDEKLENRTYFSPVLASYVAGLLLVFGANAVTNAGQPALLYIVPCMLSTAAGIAVSRGELWDRLVPYTDPPKHHLQNKPR